MDAAIGLSQRVKSRSLHRVLICVSACFDVQAGRSSPVHHRSSPVHNPAGQVQAPMPPISTANPYLGAQQQAALQVHVMCN